MDFGQAPRWSQFLLRSFEIFDKDRKTHELSENIILFQSVPRSKSYGTKALSLVQQVEITLKKLKFFFLV